jgi:hypothetical protein
MDREEIEEKRRVLLALMDRLEKAARAKRLSNQKKVTKSRPLVRIRASERAKAA